MYKEDFVNSIEMYDSKLKLVFGIDSKGNILDDRYGLMLFEYISKGKGYYVINNKKIKFKQGDAFLFKPWENVVLTSNDYAERIYLAYTPHIGDAVSELFDKKRKYSGTYCKEQMFNFFDVLQSENGLHTAIAHLFLKNLYLCIYKPRSQKLKDKRAEDDYNNNIE